VGSVHIRTATTGDAGTIAALHTASWRATYPGMMPGAFLDGPVVAEHQREWTARLGPEWAGAGCQPYVAVAEEEGDLAGFVCLLDEPPHGVLLDNLHVHPGRTGSGIGRALLLHAFDWVAAHRPGCGLSLWVLAGNAGAMRFYERHGGRSGPHRLERFEAGFEVEDVQYTWPAEAVRERARAS
jgi:GNAT superfamily N-acetyltransferase